jgi:metallo-beta-lactamase family protein
LKLTFWGAARTVTGSKHLLELDNGKRLLLDCGMFQGRRAEADRLNRELPFAAASIDAVLLSHAHIDHSGLLPRLVSAGFRGKIWATHATYDLSTLMLLDSAHIHEKDVAFVNRLHASRGKPPVEPLYTREDAEAVLAQFIGISYRQPFSPVDGVSVEYRDAGHILGSASMVLTVTEGGKVHKLGFTGDVGHPDRPLLRDPQPMPDCDWLICESTYGGKVHPPPNESLKRLEDVVTRTVARGGKIIIPAFAVGRTQEIVHALDKLWDQGRLPAIPVYVDSPLAVSATAVYLAHPDCYGQELRQHMQNDSDPFGWERLTYVRSVEQSKALNDTRFPMIIISASGMCEGGRVLHHLRNNIEDSRTTVMIVGYCADHTLGKRIVDREPVVRIFGEEHRLRAEVVVMNNYSAHADEPGLLDFVGKLDRDRLRRIFLVHGEPVRQDAFRAALAARGYRDVAIPDHGTSVRL